MKKPTGKLFVISAPSGAGKTTLVNKILRQMPQCIKSVSVTTRPPRPGEVDGVDYHFVEDATFQAMDARGEFFEREQVHGHFYGTPRSPLEQAIGAGKNILLDIDTRGALTVKRAYPASCLIFLKPPSTEILEQRLRSRRTEPEPSLKKRLEAARVELAEQNKFDYVIINDDLERAVQKVREIINRTGAKRR